jgi:hypothetical protein
LRHRRRRREHQGGEEQQGASAYEVEVFHRALLMDKNFR